MTAPVTCPDWPITYPGDCPALDTVPDPLVFEQMAAQYLWNWTGRIYGTCPVQVRPCRSDCAEGVATFWGGGPYSRGSALRGSAPWTPVLLAGQWFNVACGSCGDGCSCGGSTPALRLPSPVAAVTEVLIDGAALPQNAYRVDNHALLVRTDGGAWPTCQDMAAPPTAPDTFQVSYDLGSEVPVGGQIAAGVLACELAKATTHDRSCQLPQRVQTIARQGVTVNLIDAFDDVEKGRTGLWVVDGWVSSVTQPRRGGQVYSVDIPRPRNRVTTWP